MSEYIQERNHTAVRNVEENSVINRHTKNISVSIETDHILVIFVGKVTQRSLTLEDISFYIAIKNFSDLEQ